MVFDRTCRGPRSLAGAQHDLGSRSPTLSAAWLSRRESRRDELARSTVLSRGIRTGAPDRGNSVLGSRQMGRRADRRGTLRRAPLVDKRPAPTVARRDPKAPGSPEALFWFRTCETLGATRGQRFAAAFGEAMGCRVAGHTFVISYWQSGLHVLGPGERPSWDQAEGLIAGKRRRSAPGGTLAAEFTEHDQLPTEPDPRRVALNQSEFGPRSLRLRDLERGQRFVVNSEIPRNDRRKTNPGPTESGRSSC